MSNELWEKQAPSRIKKPEAEPKKEAKKAAPKKKG